MLKKIIKNTIYHYLIPNKIFLFKKNSQQLFLTFDDGPEISITEDLLLLLREQNVRATFFVIGKKLKLLPKIALAIDKDEHILANHSYTHRHFNKLNEISRKEEINTTRSLIRKTINKDSKLFRSPQGKWDLKLLLKLRKEGITAVHWNRDSLDFKATSHHEIINNFKNKPVKGGDIILFHDDNPMCINALKELIPLWKQQGYSFGTL